jgi:Putative DNA-binding domain
MYKETLHKLNESIIQNTPEQTLPLLKQNPKISKEKQLAVYIDGYRLRLSGAVETDYPAFCYYLGKRDSAKIIADFVEDNNSEFYSLDFYPFKFAHYLKDKKLDTAAKELALLESNIAEIFMKPDSDSLDPQIFLKMSEAELDKFRFTARTASNLLEFEYDVENFIRDFREDKSPKKIKRKKNYIFIVRHDNSVKRHYLLQEEFHILKKLIKGNSLDEAVSGMNSDLANEMLPQFLQKWLINGFFAG